MITTITHSPHTYTPAWSPVVWTALSDNIANSGFLYVFDVYLKGALTDTKIGRIKQPANPAGYASIDVSTILQPYLNPAEALPEVQALLGYTDDFYHSTDLIQGTYLLVGEEYGGVLYTGLSGGTAGDPGATAMSRTGEYVRVWAASENIIKARQNDVSGWDDYGVYDENVMRIGSTCVGYHITVDRPSGIVGYEFFYTDCFGASASVIIDNHANADVCSTTLPVAEPGASASYYTITQVPGCGSVTGKFLTSPITEHRLRLQDMHSLTFFNREIGSTGAQSPARLKVVEYGATGATFGTTYLYNIVGTGGGPRYAYTDAIGATMWVTADQELEVVLCGPTTMNFNSFTDHYTVELIGPSGDSMSEQHTFYVYEDCPGQYPSIRFSWLNKHGGRDYWNFDKYYEIDFHQKSDKYYKDPNDFSSSTWSLNSWSSGTRIYNKEIERAIKVTSDWIDTDQMEYLKGMFESPNVLVYLPGEILPQLCLVNESSFKQKLKIAEKMYNLEFDVILSFPDRVQNT